MRLGELILRPLCRTPESGDYGELAPGHDGDAMTLLLREFPDFLGIIKGKRVADYGCGVGDQSVALALRGASYVCGIDTNPRAISIARCKALDHALDSDRLEFFECSSRLTAGTFDIVMSKDSMEHFPDPTATLREMARLVHPRGMIVITFGPPWYAPYGAHMQFFCRVPWLNLLFTERTVMNVRARYRDDGAMRYEDVEFGLNRMSVGRFERIVTQAGLEIAYRKYCCVKSQQWTLRIPILRELFVSHVSTILKTRST